MGSTADPEARNRLAQRCLDVNQQYPGTLGGVTALLLATTQAPKTPAGLDAARLFAEQIETADLEVLVKALDHGGVRSGIAPRFGRPLLARIRREPDHPRCARLLAKCCGLLAPEGDGEPSALFREAADLIAERYAASPDINNFCELLGGMSGSSPLWAVRYEPHLCAILEVNQDRKVRCAAQYGLASVVMIAGDERQAEVEALFEKFLSEFDGSHKYPYQGIEQMCRDTAQDQLMELRFRAVGKPAPEIEGLDLNDRPIKLSDYRGRAVLLNFWGTWCFPCMKLVPHERALVAAYEGRPFDIVGVNCADEVESARAAAARTGMTWRSLRNETGDRPAITKEWKILGYPTLYLIDHYGTIRKRLVGSPPPDELRRMVNVLVEAAENHVAADAMPLIAAARPVPRASFPAPPSPDPADNRRPGTGFVDKVYRDRDGSAAKYVVFVPTTYDGSKPVPAILYLHGSGARGTDGRAHLVHGLAPAIRAKSLDFPFLVIFPQARQGEDWLVGMPGGQRALAILAQTAADYRIDPDRIALTGVSMGGAGTWSLAAADSQRWSAIVPISHGGDTATAAKLVGIPCWCFHGEADRMIPPQESRKMVAAITKAGGRPLYQEFAGVGHNDCAEHVYSMNDLYEWLLAQDRSRR